MLQQTILLSQLPVRHHAVRLARQLRLEFGNLAARQLEFLGRRLGAGPLYFGLQLADASRDIGTHPLSSLSGLMETLFQRLDLFTQNGNALGDLDLDLELLLNTSQI